MEMNYYFMITMMTIFPQIVGDHFLIQHLHTMLDVADCHPLVVGLCLNSVTDFDFELPNWGQLGIYVIKGQVHMTTKGVRLEVFHDYSHFFNLEVNKEINFNSYLTDKFI